MERIGKAGTDDSRVNDKHLYAGVPWCDSNLSDHLDMGVMNEWSRVDWDVH